MPGGRVLVPLCGKSLDMLWLREQGYRVAGIEISEVAVAAFFDEQGLRPARSDMTHGSRWSADGIDIYCGDFFRLVANEIGALDACYDRAALVALPEGMRRDYVMRLAELLTPGATGLLVTLDYDQAEMDGPPFAVPPGEVMNLFMPAFAVEELHDADVLAARPEFRERGLHRLHEHVFRLARRTGT